MIVHHAENHQGVDTDTMQGRISSYGRGTAARDGYSLRGFNITESDLSIHYLEKPILKSILPNEQTAI